MYAAAAPHSFWSKPLAHAHQVARKQRVSVQLSRRASLRPRSKGRPAHRPTTPLVRSWLQAAPPPAGPRCPAQCRHAAQRRPAPAQGPPAAGGWSTQAGPHVFQSGTVQLLAASRGAEKTWMQSPHLQQTCRLPASAAGPTCTMPAARMTGGSVPRDASHTPLPISATTRPPAHPGRWQDRLNAAFKPSN